MAKSKQVDVHRLGTSIWHRRDRHPGIAIPEAEGRTHQEFKDECDINNIMKRYKPGDLVPGAVGSPKYVDYSDAPDMITAMQMFIDAKASFDRLPALVRREFDNDPTLFVEFASDKNNLPKLREWGLAAPEKLPEPPMRVEVVNPASPDKEAPKAS